MIVIARSFHTSKLKIDASHKQLYSHKHDDRRSSLCTYTCRINWRSGCPDAVECILIAILENVITQYRAVEIHDYSCE